MQNKIEDLRKILFDQLNRLNEPDVDMAVEGDRASSIVQVATTLLEAGRLEVEYVTASQQLLATDSTFFASEDHSGNIKRIQEGRG